MASDLTIYIPTFGRQHMLKHIIEYYTDTDYEIIIGDATREKLDMDLRKLGNGKARYFHMPNLPYAERYNFALQKCRTPFFIPRADRRHLTIHFSRKAIDFLDKNQDYDNVMGIWLDEDLTPSYNIDLITRIGSIDNPYDRMKYHSLSYEPSFYSLQRVEKARKIGKLMLDLYKIVDNPYLVEYILSFYTYFTSKVAKIPVLHALNQTSDKVDDYTINWNYVPYILSNPSMLTNIFNAFATYISEDYTDLSELKSAFAESCKNFILRFSVEGICTHQSLMDSNSTIEKYAVFEDVFTRLANGGAMRQKDHDLLRLLMSTIFIHNIEFEDLIKIFTKEDIKELNSIKNMISKIRQQMSASM